MKTKRQIFTTAISGALLLGSVAAQAETPRGEFLLLPVHALFQADEEGLKAASKTLFHLEDGSKITFLSAEKVGQVLSSYKAASKLPAQATFRMVIDELEGAARTPALNAELSISLSLFMREGLTGFDLDREGLSFTPLAGDLAQLNPILFAEMNSAAPRASRRVLFHWEVKVGDRFLKIFLPQGGVQVSRQVTLSQSTS